MTIDDLIIKLENLAYNHDITDDTIVVVDVAEEMHVHDVVFHDGKVKIELEYPE